jgi:hypothetical protein
MILGFAIQSNIFSNMVARGVLKLGSKRCFERFLKKGKNSRS